MLKCQKCHYQTVRPSPRRASSRTWTLASQTSARLDTASKRYKLIKTSRLSSTSPLSRRHKSGRTTSAAIMRRHYPHNTSHTWRRRTLLQKPPPKLPALNRLAFKQVQMAQSNSTVTNLRLGTPRWSPKETSPHLPWSMGIQTVSQQSHSNLSLKLRSVNSGNSTEPVSTETLAHSLTALMSSSRGQTCTRTTRLSSAKDSTKISTAHMDQGASSCTMSHRPRPRPPVSNNPKLKVWKNN